MHFNRSQFLLSALVIFGVSFTGMAALAEWSTSPYQNNPVDVRPERAYEPKSVPDGNGGLIVFYMQEPSAWDNNYDLFAQRIDSNGDVAWGAPVVVRSIVDPDYILFYDVLGDGSGGAFIAMQISIGGVDRVRLQHLTHTGSLSWTPLGIELVPNLTGFDMLYPQMVLDDAGGVIVAWTDYGDVANTQTDIYAQRVDATGSLLWGNLGANVCRASEDQKNVTMASDGEGGVYIAWSDERNGPEADIFGQRLLANRTPAWTVNGIALQVSPELVISPSLVEVGANGGFLLASLVENGVNYQVLVKKFTSAGTLVWSQYPGEDAGLAQYYPIMIPDGEGGAFVAWLDGRDPTYPGGHYYAQSLGANGQPRWLPVGVSAGLGNGSQIRGSMVFDGAGGIVLVWTDDRNTNGDIYGQRIDIGGAKRWGLNGRAICSGPFHDTSASVHPDTRGGFLAAFTTGRAQAKDDVYAQRIGFHGKLGDASPTITTVTDHPQDQGGVVRLEWDRSYLDDYEYTGIGEYTIWRQYGGGAKQAVLDGPELEKEADRVASATDLDVDMVMGQLKAGWSYVDQIDASYWEAYAYEAPTFADSTAAGVILTDFKVVAHQSQFVFWESDVVSGYSVDNFAPAAPSMLMASYLNPDGLLEWSPSTVSVPDLAGYRVYRSDLAGFTPGPASFVGATPDTVFADNALTPGTWFYLVTAEDFHNNESQPSNQAELATDVSAVGNNLPTAFRVAGAVPNPFNPSTKIHFTLAGSGHTTVDVFDTRGRLVRRLMDQTLGAGPHEAAWDGRDDQGRGLPSGVYLAQVRSGRERGIKKMVLAK